MIGVGRAAAPPPSEPYRRISRIRLSGRWSYLRRIDESKLPEREKLSDLRRDRLTHPSRRWVVNMRRFDRNSVFSPARFTEASPACLAGWHSGWLLRPVRLDSSSFLRSFRSIPVPGLLGYSGRSDSCGAGSGTALGANAGSLLYRSP